MLRTIGGSTYGISFKLEYRRPRRRDQQQSDQNMAIYVDHYTQWGRKDAYATMAKRWGKRVLLLEKENLTRKGFPDGPDRWRLRDAFKSLSTTIYHTRMSFRQGVCLRRTKHASPAWREIPGHRSTTCQL